MPQWHPKQKALLFINFTKEIIFYIRELPAIFFFIRNSFKVLFLKCYYRFLKKNYLFNIENFNIKIKGFAKKLKH